MSTPAKESKWLITYSDWPGRYYVVCLEHPRWYYVFDHVGTAEGCEMQSVVFASIDRNHASEEIFDKGYADAAYRALSRVQAWFVPMPVCDAPHEITTTPRWVFGITPELCRDERKLIAFRIEHPQHLPAVLTFDEEGSFYDIDAADNDFALEAYEAFQLWSCSNQCELSRQRFML